MGFLALRLSLQFDLYQLMLYHYLSRKAAKKEGEDDICHTQTLKHVTYLFVIDHIHKLLIDLN